MPYQRGEEAPPLTSGMLAVNSRRVALSDSWK